MSKLWGALAAMTACVFAFTLYPRSTCERTLAYAVGDVDPRFAVSREQVIEAAARAAELWDEAAGERVFRYDPAAPFAIHLHYDERQPRALQALQAKARIESEDAALREVHGRYESLKAAYDEDGRAFERHLAAWRAGGRPADRARALEDERRALNAEAERLNFMVRQLRPAAASLRSEVANLNAQGGRAFERGDFTGERIDVYQFDDGKDLALILAHEFGHALSVEHVPDPKAVMYYLRNDQNFKELALTDADEKGLRLACAQLSIIDPRTVARWRESLRRLTGR